LHSVAEKEKKKKKKRGKEKRKKNAFYNSGIAFYRDLFRDVKKEGTFYARIRP